MSSIQIPQGKSPFVKEVCYQTTQYNSCSIGGHCVHQLHFVTYFKYVNSTNQVI